MGDVVDVGWCGVVRGSAGWHGVARVWRGDEENEYGVAAVIGTLAIALRLIDKSLAQDKATEQAQTLWQERDLTKFN